MKLIIRDIGCDTYEQSNKTEQIIDLNEKSVLFTIEEHGYLSIRKDSTIKNAICVRIFKTQDRVVIEKRTP